MKHISEAPEHNTDPKEHVSVGNGEIHHDVAVFVLVAACYVALES